jgi:hypothetical protein
MVPGLQTQRDGTSAHVEGDLYGDLMNLSDSPTQRGFCGNPLSRSKSWQRRWLNQPYPSF